ncbi:MAG TPA: hypothetical protein DD414_03505 [Lachnospiraceae bacterium]|nr:hypothetical protein [Lachnospiraceae bacterium]
MKQCAGKEIALKRVKISDSFWEEATKLVRKEVIPYQWKLLNDQVEDAAPSFCMRNFRIAGKVTEEKQKADLSNRQLEYTYRGFEVLPENQEMLKDEFYGFVFQDSDLYKWIEAAAYSLTGYPDPELEKTVDEAIDLVCRAQQENGYLDTYYIINGMSHIFTNLKDHHELYCMGHLIEAAIAYQEATGKDRLLQAAMRFADYVDSVFGPQEGKRKGYPGHEIAEMALLRLYEVTGEEKYRKLAQFFIDERGKKPWYWMQEPGYKAGDELRYAYNQSHLPVREQEEAVGHAVRAMYLYAGMADLARLTGDESLWNACRKLWDNTVNQKMYITGGIGAVSEGEAFSFAYDLPNDLAYAETCASVGLIFWAWRMLKQEARSEYADVMELALYNTVLAGMALDGKSFFYTNPLEVVPEACYRDVRKAHIKPVRQKWFGCACCPPNLARTIGSVGRYAFTENEHVFWVHLYVGAEITVNESPVRLTTGFPWKGEVKLNIGKDMEKEYSFAFRIPGWCEGYELTTGCKMQKEEKDGYLYLTRKWREGDEVRLQFPMSVTGVIANQMVREDIGKAAVKRGPLVYCLEEKDNGKNLHLLKVKLPLDAKEEEVFELDHFFIRICVPGIRYGLRRTKALYQAYEEEQTEDVILNYVPYFIWNNRGEGEMQVWTRY